MSGLDDAVSAWPGYKHGSPGEYIEFACPVCGSPGYPKPEVTYWVRDGKLTCPCGCDPSDVEKALRTGETGKAKTLDQMRPAEPGSPESRERKILAEVEWLEIREEARRRHAEKLAAEFADDWFGVTLEDFDPGPEPVPCVLEYAPGLHAFAPGVRILFGKRGTLKSWIELEAVRQELKRGNRALMIDYEMSADKVFRRLTALGAPREDLARFVYVQGGPVGDQARANLARRFADGPPSLVVLDSIGLSMAAAGYSTNDDTETGEWYTAVPKWMARQWPGAVVLLIDHTPKGSESARDPIGSQRKGAFSDGLFLVEKDSKVSKTTRGGGHVTLTKDRDGDGEEDAPLFEFEFGGGGPLTLSLPDPKAVSADLSGEGVSDDEEPVLLRIAVYVGQNEGAKVEQARASLGIRGEDFDRLKRVLVARNVIEHRKRVGLFKAAGWPEYVPAV